MKNHDFWWFFNYICFWTFWNRNSSEKYMKNCGNFPKISDKVFFCLKNLYQLDKAIWTHAGWLSHRKTKKCRLKCWFILKPTFISSQLLTCTEIWKIMDRKMWKTKVRWPRGAQMALYGFCGFVILKKTFSSFFEKNLAIFFAIFLMLKKILFEKFGNISL